MTHSGRCYCGKINYEFEEPIYTQILCHCSMASLSRGQSRRRGVWGQESVVQRWSSIAIFLYLLSTVLLGTTKCLCDG